MSELAGKASQFSLVPPPAPRSAMVGRGVTSEVQELLHQRQDREAKSDSKLLPGEVDGVIYPSYS